MGIYYFAVDFTHKEMIKPPGHFADKFPGVCHPDSPFPGMIVMMNCRGSSFEIVDDMSFDSYGSVKDVTEEVYREYIELFPFYRREI